MAEKKYTYSFNIDILFFIMKNYLNYICQKTKYIDAYVVPENIPFTVILHRLNKNK
jgi:hypothetical protein